MSGTNGDNGASALAQSPSDTKIVLSLQQRLEKLEAEVRTLRGPATPAGVKTVPPVMLSMTDVLDGLGPEASVIREPSTRERYKDRSCVIVCPTRGMIAHEVVQSWKQLVMPMNQKHSWHFASGYDVASAYNALVDSVLDHKILSRWTYILTLEDDNLPPYDAVLRLMDTMEAGPNGDGSSTYDGVSGLYFVKDSTRAPMAYGSYAEFKASGYAHYYPVDLSAVESCAETPCEDPSCRKHVLDVNGIAQGCALFRMDLYRRMWEGGHKKPFMTCEDKILVDGELIRPDVADGMMELEPGKGYKKLVTQDLGFCDLAIHKYSARFAVDIRVGVGHLDIQSGRVY